MSAPCCNANNECRCWQQSDDRSAQKPMLSKCPGHPLPLTDRHYCTLHFCSFRSSLFCADPVSDRPSKGAPGRPAPMAGRGLLGRALNQCWPNPLGSNVTRLGSRTHHAGPTSGCTTPGTCCRDHSGCPGAERRARRRCQRPSGALGALWPMSQMRRQGTHCDQGGHGLGRMRLHWACSGLAGPVPICPGPLASSLIDPAPGCCRRRRAPSF